MRPDGYKIELELLASLSLVPTPIADLRNEFGLTLESEVRVALDRLRPHGVMVEYHHVSGEMVVQVCPGSWSKAKSMCEAYWARVYPAEPQVA